MKSAARYAWVAVAKIASRMRSADHVFPRRICQLVIVRQQSFDLVNIEYSVPLEEADLALDLIAGLTLDQVSY